MGKLIILFRKISLLEKFLWKHRINFEKTAETYSTEVWKFVARSPKLMRRPYFFHTKVFFLKTVLWTLRVQFSQLYQVFFWQKVKKICSITETDKETPNFLSGKHFSTKRSFDTWNAVLETPVKSFRLKPDKLSLNVRTRYEKHKFFKELKNVPTDVKNAVLTKPPKRFQHLVKKFQLKIMKWWKILLFSK